MDVDIMDLKKDPVFREKVRMVCLQQLRQTEWYQGGEPTEDGPPEEYECELLKAARDKNHDRVAELLQHGEDVNKLDLVGMTALHYAAQLRDPVMLRLLLEAGADPNILSNYHRYCPLHLAILSIATDLSIVRSLLRAGADADLADRRGQTILHYLALMGNATAVKDVLEAGANINAQDDSGWTPLLWASYNNHEEVVDTLLAAGAKVELTEKEGWTALHWAASHASVNIVRSLLRAGANPNALDKDGCNAVYMASATDRGAPTHATIDLLVEAGGEINKPGLIGWTALHRAAAQESPELVQFLLQRGAKPDIQDLNGNTALHLATDRAKTGTIRALLAGGASVVIRNLSWRTPFFMALHTLQTELICVYLGAGAVLHHRTRECEQNLLEAVSNWRISLRSPYRPPASNNPAVPRRIAAASLFAAYEAGVLSRTSLRRAVGVLRGRRPPNPPAALSLRVLARLTIQAHTRKQDAETYAQLGLPQLMQQFLLFEKPFQYEPVMVGKNKCHLHLN